MNYETLLLNSIIDTGNIADVIEQGAGIVFDEHKDIWNYLIEFNNEYGSVPSKDVVKSQFKSFEFIKAESPLQYYIDDAMRQSLSKNLRSSLIKSVELLKADEDPQKIITLLQNDTLELIRGSGRLKDTNIVDFSERSEILLERINNPNHVVNGVPSGISVIDAHFGGFQPGDFIVVIGWTGVGKSALTRLFAANAWRAGYSPLIISLEMDKTQEQFRMDTILNRGEVFTNTQLTNGREIDFGVYKDWAKETYYGKHPLHLVTAEGIESADQHFVQAKIDQYKPPLVILDYHTLFDDAKGGGTEVERAKNLSKAFKRMAVRNNIAVIDVSAVTMEDGKHDERPPLLSEIAWSKQLSYDADMVLAVHRPHDSNIFTVVTRKTRRCSPFAFYLEWDLNSGNWREVYEQQEI